MYRRLWWIAVGIAALVLLSLVAPAALAHSFLATTRPAQGERLPSAPREVALQLSEPVVLDEVLLDVAGVDGRPVEVGRLEEHDGGLVVRLPLVDTPDGLYRVSWHVVSAVDGHGSAGEFTFAVGDVATLATSGGEASDRGVPWVASLGTWLFLGGWSLAFGAGWLALRAGGSGWPGRPRTWVRTGAAVALVGLALRVGVSGATGQTAAVTLTTAFAVVAGMTLTRVTPLAPSLSALGMVAVVWPARGHGASGGALGWALDSVHLAAAGIWVGGLAVVVTALAVAARRGVWAPTSPLVWRYAKDALLAVVVLTATGIGAALLLVPSLQELFTGTYGRLLLAKTALLAVAVGAAVVARWRQLPRDRTGGLRRLTGSELGALATALAVAAVLIDVTPPQPATAEMLLGPPPIDGPVARAAGMAGYLTIDVQAGDGRLDVNVRGPAGGIPSELDLTAILPDGTDVELHPRPCGDGCSTLHIDLPVGETTLRAAAAADGWSGGTTELTLMWPPPSEQPELFEQMREAMRSAGSVRVQEAAGEDPPTGGGAPMDGRSLVALMPWAGGGVTDVRPVPGQQGRFTFYLPGSYTWFDVSVDDTGRLLSQRLVNPGHDIRYRFTYPPDGPAAEPTDPTTAS